MTRRGRAWWGAWAIVGLLLASCGGAGGARVPTQQELEASLLTASELGGDWRAVADFPPGILSDEMRAEFSLPEPCPAAGAAALEAAAGLEWQVGAAFARGEAPEGGYVPSLVQLMLAGEPDEVASAFATLRDGFGACAGVDQVFEGEGSFRIEAVPLPGVGDGGVGLRYQQTGAPPGHAHFDMRLMLVREGAVIMWLNETEITLADEPTVAGEELEAILTAAVDKLP